MELVTQEDYLAFLNNAREVQIEKTRVPLKGPYRTHVNHPPVDYVPESTTVWSFPDRGDWATHSGSYRGNWSPYIPRNLILRYTGPGDVILDQMAGSGTTLVECRLLGRHAIGVDVNRDAVMVARDRLAFEYTRPTDWPSEGEVSTYVGDCRCLDKIGDDTIDLIATHPPYAGIITYSRNRVPGDLSSLSLNDYLGEMRKAAAECLRVLKAGKHCAILIGDTRKRLHYVPISHRIMQIFLDVGFILREDIIKLQWKTKTTRERWRGREYPFYKIAHEHLFVFRKPTEAEKLSEVKNSLKWWRDQLAFGLRLADVRAGYTANGIGRVD
ncbi:MAG: DNA methylase [Chloroflexi bacterium]|nr:DNA methylase [Chloroflexota bacterium]